MVSFRYKRVNLLCDSGHIVPSEIMNDLLITSFGITYLMLREGK